MTMPSFFGRCFEPIDAACTVVPHFIHTVISPTPRWDQA